MPDLLISPDLSLPDSAATDTFAMLAKRGTGKSNAAVVMAEEMWRLGQPFVALDPKGDWYGIRSNAAGDGPGLPIPVFGGLHGDLPLEPEAGPLMARLILELGMTCVLDLSDFSKTQQVRFATEFAQTLWTMIRKEPRALHLFLEEAEEFLPQQVRGGKEPVMVGLYQKLAKQGRTFGLGITLITQRSASLSKDALSQTENLILFKTTLPADKATVAGWIDDPDQAKEVRASLAQLSPGESWVIAPGIVGAPRRIQWARRTTFDSGATPKVGTKRREPVGLADIDLGAIEAEMAGVVERVEADDPARLKREVARLTKELAERPAAEPTEPVRVEVPVLSDEAIATLTDAGERAEALFKKADELRRSVEELLTAVGLIEVTAKAAVVAPVQPPRPPAPPARVTRAERLDAAGAPTGQVVSLGDDLPITGLNKSILSVLAQQSGPTSLQRLGLLTKKSPKGGYFAKVLGQLRAAGYVEKGQPITITDAGRAAVAGQWEPIPTGAEALDYWAEFFGGLGGKLLRLVADGQGHEKDEMPDAVGATPDGGYFAKVLGQLRTAGLVEKGWPLRATDELLDAIA